MMVPVIVALVALLVGLSVIFINNDAWIAAAIIIAAVCVGFLITSGMLALILWCFGAYGYFSWKLALGVFLIIWLVKDIFKSASSKE